MNKIMQYLFKGKRDSSSLAEDARALWLSEFKHESFDYVKQVLLDQGYDAK